MLLVVRARRNGGKDENCKDEKNKGAFGGWMHGDLDEGIIHCEVMAAGVMGDTGAEQRGSGVVHW